MRLRIFFALILLLFMANYGDVFAETSARDDLGTTTNAPVEVQVGVYVSSIHNIDLMERTFETSFYAWWKHGTPDFMPYESNEITNAQSFKIAFKDSSIHKSFRHSNVRYVAKLNKDWDLTYYPFDRQVLRIKMEDFSRDTRSLILKLDKANSKINPDLKLDGWEVVGMDIKSGVTIYQSNLGDPTAPSVRTYSNINVEITLKRQGWWIFFYSFIGIFVAFLICIFTFLISPERLGARLTLAIGAIFLIVGNLYVLDTSLPMTKKFTLVDAIQIATLITILSTIILTIILYFLSHKGKKGLSQRVNLDSMLLLIITYVGYILYEVIQALSA